METLWVTKYAPQTLDNVILSNQNKKLIKNIIELHKIPNCIFYGLPGTGKSVTVNNLIESYSNKWGKLHTLTINASSLNNSMDVIYEFATTWNMYDKEFEKVLIFEEADYMDNEWYVFINYLIELDNNPVPLRIFLLCNYKYKIPDWLLSKLLPISYVSQTMDNLICYFQKIKKTEDIKISTQNLKLLIKLHNMDIRTIVNKLQHYHMKQFTITKPIDNSFELLYDKVINSNMESIDKNMNFITTLLIKYNMDILTFIQQFIEWVCEFKPEVAKKLKHKCKWLIDIELSESVCNDNMSIYRNILLELKIK